MATENNQIDFSNQPIFIGIDVHKKSWTVTVRATEIKMNTHSMNPLPNELDNYLKKNYPVVNIRAFTKPVFAATG